MDGIENRTARRGRDKTKTGSAVILAKCVTVELAMTKTKTDANLA